ncbi:ParB/RepB/Spo0J family partition protein [uncultured Limosilactobacillus sp.]|uniref:ParB/RepB/Spo0J family partition protein n=1 Tax=uncultured Limosilactobacillus sp. TaxID=2837629 RepID=UPI0025E42C97|nr:ParB/RepB/Spo0J family partition protein [uncultured Limosilactobacillus sp.]
MAKNKKMGLGRGIEALFAENDVQQPQASETVEQVELAKIRPNPYQPRREFDKQALKELAKSIDESGVFQPVILRQPNPQLERYELIAGERRFRASKLAHKKTIPAIIRTMTDEQVMEAAILENLQREDLTPLEEAQGYATLMDKLSLTQAEVAKKLGKSRPYIANYLRLLGLPDQIKQLVDNGDLSMGQARTLLGLKDKRQLLLLAKRAVDEGLTVRQLEEIVNRQNGKAKKKVRRQPQKSIFIRDAEEQLQDRFGTKVLVSPSKTRGRGKIEIPYTSNDDLSRVLNLLGIKED